MSDSKAQEQKELKIFELKYFGQRYDFLMDFSFCSIPAKLEKQNKTADYIFFPHSRFWLSSFSTIFPFGIGLFQR